MRAGKWSVVAIGMAMLVSGSGRAEPILLRETVKEGDCHHVVIKTSLTGNLKVAREDKTVPLPVKASNDHDFVERVLTVDKSVAKKVARYYETAQSVAQVDSDKIERSLRSDRRRIVAQRIGEGLLTYAPAGPLTQSEVEVVSEHFDTLHLMGLLSDKETELGEKWKISNAIAQSMCLFDGLISQDLEGTLESTKEGVATIRVLGTAKGIENGAMATLTVEAMLSFDSKAAKITGITWKQKDIRDQGPVSPAADVETQTTVKRESLKEEPKELSSAALIGVPSEDDPPGVVKQLSHTDPKGRYRFAYARDWHVVGQTDHHLVMRLLDRGDFVAQMTMTMWKNAGAGKHLSPDEFQKIVSASPGWAMEQVVDHGEVAGDADRWAYRITARGELDGTKVVQNFYLIANTLGEQMIVTFTMKPTNLARLGTKDLAVVNAVEIIKK
ncbi:hypothetical protein [Zavarzinella formosa]|uniref:hypothetical protein n=1 Tax=Zavarzinella formosa TaxID=360055 RepID=UPI000313F458|nr:hypothetical protein [Zavarzinella formosa]